MYKSPSHLPEAARKSISETLNGRLSDGLDLHSQIKVAHWNIKGPQFPGLHPLFETFAVSLANHNDSIAERAVTLGGRAYGTARHVGKTSRLPVQFACRYRVANSPTFIVSEISEIGTGGALLTTPSPLPLDTELTVEVTPPGGAAPIAIAGRVSYHAPSGGSGLVRSRTRVFDGTAST